MTPENTKIAIVGSGLGGLSAAISLASNGYDVEVFEKNTRPGGKMNFHQSDSYYFDTGPSLLTMPFVINELFNSAGEELTDHLKIIRIDTSSRNFFSDGVFIDSSSEVEKFANNISKLSTRDALNLDKYLEYSRKIYESTAHIFLFEPFHEIKKLRKEGKIPSLATLFKIDALRTVHKANSSFFSHRDIVKIFDRFATYNGSNPYRAPATLNIIPYVEYIIGSYYVMGGMYKLADRLYNLALNLGVGFKFDCPVENIIIKNNVALGLKSRNGENFYDFIISNADVVETYNHLIKGFERTRQRLNQLEPSMSGFIFLWGINGLHQGMEHHNVFFADDYRKEFEEVFLEKMIPGDPTVYISISSKRELKHAPSGCENWFVLVNTPYLNENINWAASVDFLREKVLNKLKKYGFDIESKIEYEKVFTPHDLYKMYGSNKGSIYGISSNSKMTAFKRPANRSREIKNLYFASGSVHPGGGIPLAILSGKHCANLIKYKIENGE